MQLSLGDIFESDLVPEQFEREIKKEVMDVAGIEKKTMVGQLYNYYDCDLISKKHFNGLRSWAFVVLNEKSQKAIPQRG